MKKTRKRFIRPVKTLAELYNKDYNFVRNIYLRQGCCVVATKMILNIL